MNNSAHACSGNVARSLFSDRPAGSKYELDRSDCLYPEDFVLREELASASILEKLVACSSHPNAVWNMRRNGLRPMPRLSFPEEHKSPGVRRVESCKDVAAACLGQASPGRSRVKTVVGGRWRFGHTVKCGRIWRPVNSATHGHIASAALWDRCVSGASRKASAAGRNPG